MGKVSVTRPRAGEIGEPQRKWLIIPRVVPVPLPLPDHEAEPAPAAIPEREPEEIPA